MSKNEIKMPLPKLDDLFTTQEERDYEKLEKVVDIKLSDIKDFPNHPFKVLNNEEMELMKESIEENGVLIPVLVRPKEDGTYEMVSGHRRKFASQLAGKETIPCIIRDLTDDEAIIIMVDSNMQREKILPSEKAHAYKMKMEAMSHQGKSTSRQLGEKLETADLIGSENGDSGRQVQRYIRLNELIPQLLEMVDNTELNIKPSIAFSPAVELSYLTEEEQYILLDCIDYNVATPSHAQAIMMKKMSQSGTLTEDAIDEIMSQEKPNQIPKIKFSEERIRSVLPKNIEDDKIEDYVVTAISYYERHQRQKQMGAR